MSATAVLVFDMLEGYRKDIEAAGTLGAAVRLVDSSRESGARIVYAYADHRADGADAPRCYSDVDSKHQPWSSENPWRSVPRITSGSASADIVEELEPTEDDLLVPKHRWNAFHGTHLDLSLRCLGVRNVIVLGGSTHVGIASTVYGARDLDYQVTVASDACHGRKAQRQFFLENVFPRVCQVRSVDEIINALPSHPTETVARRA